MDKVFSTDDFAPTERYAAWREAICDVYVNVDVKASDPARYRGFIHEAQFGAVSLTDILLSEQRIRRGRTHLSRLDKDCYYVQLLHRGGIEVHQRGAQHHSTAARGAIFLASEEYELQGHGEVRSFYLELPRAEFAQRFSSNRVPVSAPLNTAQGLGRIVSDFCATLATESPRLQGPQREAMGAQVMDLLAIALQAAEDDAPMGEASVKAARLRSVQHWIEGRLADPELTLERVAAANGMSLRSLHLLFEGGEMSASEWIWHRRLQRAHDCLARGEGGTITGVAFDHGFNSSAHFSTMFRRRFGLSPRDVARRRH